MKIAVTGANSSVGIALLKTAAAQGIAVNAGVRSERAASSLPEHERIAPRIIDYGDPDSLDGLLSGCDSAVHLAGILIPNRGAGYREANVDATAAVADAARHGKLRSLVFISVLGADAKSGNPYFRSKGEAELVATGRSPAGVIIRTPILLGPGSAGSASLLASAKRGKASLPGGGANTLRPLDIDDLCAAVLNACRKPRAGVHELAGPESLSYRELVERTAELLGQNMRIRGFPIWLAKLGAAAVSRLRGGITPAVIDVITSEDTVSRNADTALGIELTPLSQTLAKFAAAEQPQEPKPQ